LFTYNETLVTYLLPMCCICNRILICPVIEEDRSIKKSSFKVDGKVSCMKYLDNRVYIGLKTGTLLVYSCDKGLRYF